MPRILVFFALVLLCPMLRAQSVAVIENVSISIKEEGLVDIYYDITKAQPGETFSVWVKVFSPDGREISARSFSGDVGEKIAAGAGRRITWNAAQDLPDLSTTCRFEVFARSDEIKIPFMKSVFFQTTWRSLILPGWGQSLNHRKPYWLAGVAGYGMLGVAILLNRQAVSDYDKYLSTLEQPARGNYFSRAEDRDRLSGTLGIGAAILWAGNTLWAAVDKPSAGRRLTLAPTGQGVGLFVGF